MVTFNSIFKDDIANYLSLRETVLSGSSFKNDVYCLLSFDKYLANTGLQEKEITEPVFNGWQKVLSGKAITRACKIVTVRTFIKYLRSLGISVYMPIVPKITGGYNPYIFSEEELNRILSAADNGLFAKGQPNPYLKTEFPMILRLLYGCGLRIGETLALQMQNIDLKGGILTLLHAKNRKHRLVPMSPSLTKILQRYCLAMGIIGTPEAFLFPSVNPERPIKIWSVRDRFNVILKNLGIALPNRNRNERGPCQHCLRHVFVFKSFAQAQANGRSIDGSVPFLSIYLGHDSLRETEKYLKFNSELFPNAMELFEHYAGAAFPEAGNEK
ncbi:MAG: tyrosine-type recombinase/integrase [Treponema sp.]|jgi:integrase|nr:tyrosine-type recombinase/integrase [Treponema sp.]